MKERDMQIVITPDGSARCVYDELLDLLMLLP